jgi:mono/diheme cytochrome c family protein
VQIFPTFSIWRHERFLVFPLILLLGLVFAAPQVTARQEKSKEKPAANPPDISAGRETFLKYCASCHGTKGQGDGPASFALKVPPPDLTTLAKRHEGRLPAGYIGALLKFGRNLAAHGSEEMPVWGTQFRSLDPVNDPTGQHHIDDLVAYLGSLQVK